MREIKFRAWTVTDNRMLDWESMLCNRSTLVCAMAGEETRQTVYLMQYTGLKDKNGVEIYEGDIVKAIYCNNYFNETREVKIFKMEMPLYDPFEEKLNGGADGSEWYEDVEVIGSIYENPELLEE